MRLGEATPRDIQGQFNFEHACQRNCVNGSCPIKHACQPNPSGEGKWRRYDLLNNVEIQEFIKSIEWTCAHTGKKYDQEYKNLVMRMATKDWVIASEIVHALDTQNVVQIEIVARFEEDGLKYNLFRLVRIQGIKNFLKDQPLKYNMRNSV